MNNYKALEIAAERKRESNDCSVKAVAAACRVSYQAAWEAMENAGRAHRGMASLAMIEEAVESLGFKMLPVNPRDFIDERYPAGHKILKSVTTHHPARFPGVFREMECWILSVAGHVAAVVDGNLVDWSEGRSLQCRHVMYRVERMNEADLQLLEQLKLLS